MSRVTELSLGYTEGRLELCVVGGFHDRRSVAEKVGVSLLSELVGVSGWSGLVAG